VYGLVIYQVPRPGYLPKVVHMSSINPYRPTAPTDSSTNNEHRQDKPRDYTHPGDTYSGRPAANAGVEAAALSPTHSDTSDPYADVDWSKVDYSGVDWSRVDYGSGNKAGAPTQAQGAANPSGGAASASNTAAGDTSRPIDSNANAVQPAGQPAVDSSKPATVSVTPTAAAAAGLNPAGTTDQAGYSLAGFGGRTDPVDNGNKDQYKGNVGVPYGSNMQKIDAADAAKYKYTNTFTNTTNKPMTISLWNKVGADGQANSGQSSAPAMTITLPPGGSQTVAFDENSQVAWAENGFGTTASGSPNTTWGEADFGDLRNQAWSGYDVSSIQNTAGNNYAMSITSNGGEASTNTSNNWTSDVQANMGAGGVLTPGVVRLNTSMSGTIA
jgi:hypothetical protein